MQNKQIVLVAESSETVCSTLCSALTAGAYHPLSAEDGRTSVSMISARCPDAVLLERTFPDIDGLEVLQRVRHWSAVPIIMLAPKERESDEVAALNSGADDYLVWPFGPEKLLARVRAVLRRSIGMERSGEVSKGVIRRGGLIIDVMHHSVTAKGCAVHLTHHAERIPHSPAACPAPRQGDRLFKYPCADLGPVRRGRPADSPRQCGEYPQKTGT